MTTECFIFARTVHFGACLLFFGILFFDRFVSTVIFNRGRSEIKTYWQSQVRVFNAVLLPVILVSGIAWFILVTIDMSGEPLQMAVLKIVWAQTQFGTVWKLRLLLWLAALTAGILYYFLNPEINLGKFFTGIQMLPAAALLGSLAWAGHGQENSPWHLAADVLHLLVAGLWPTGLAPFFLLLKKLHPTVETERIDSIVRLTRRFSILSLFSVAVLTATGLINSWFLVGSFSRLTSEPYGQWLVAKILLFFFAIAFGAVNLMRLKPRLSQPQHSASATAQLRCNIFIELMLATAVIIIVAVLGILPPACH